jgi:hypothetical protein
MNDPTGAEARRLATVVAETEPFFGDVMKVYLDLLCRGERDASRRLFRSGVRFAGAVHGLRRATADGGAAQAAAAAKHHLEHCLYALWVLQGRGAHAGSDDRPVPEEEDAGSLIQRGLVLLSALRPLVAEHTETDVVPP